MQPRWMQACFNLYKAGCCKSASCKFVHDLDPNELSDFLVWTLKTGHVIFPSDTDASSSLKTSSSSEPKAFGSSQHVAVDHHPVIEHLGYDELRLRCRNRFCGMSDVSIAAAVPPMPSGEPSSMGSVFHASGQCRPCRHILVNKLCRDGLKCIFCHLPHNTVTQQVAASFACLDEEDGLDDEGHNSDGRGGRFRPCKAKRNHYRKAVKKIEEEVMHDPWGFDMESVRVPPRIEKNPVLKKKFLMRIAFIVDTARAAIEQSIKATAAESQAAVGGEGGSPNGSTSCPQKVSLREMTKLSRVFL